MAQGVIVRILKYGYGLAVGKVSNATRYLFSSRYRLQRESDRRWTHARGDETLRLEYPLDKNSVVFDVGGYLGTWAEEILNRYGANVYIFEPIQGFSDKIEQRLGKQSNVHTYTVALGGSNRTDSIFLKDNATSLFSVSGARRDIQVLDIADFLEQHDIPRIDLMKVNIEGGEYELIERLIQTGFIKNITNLQVQFHTFVEHPEARYEAIRSRLLETHELTYSYPWIWENWRRKTNG